MCRFYYCRVVLKLFWQNTVSHDFCVKDVQYKENNYVFLYVCSYLLLNIFLSLELNIHYYIIKMGE
jgi:hypothetical protein